MTTRGWIVGVALTAASLAGLPSPAVRAQVPAAQTARTAERTAWYFYTVRWGYQDEFLDLFQRNHYPVLREQLKRGRLTSIKTYVPTYHGDGRSDWTFAVELRYRDATALMGPSDEAQIVQKLYPDQAKFRKEEQRRFEILEAHWDVPLNEIDLETRQPASP